MEHSVDIATDFKGFVTEVRLAGHHTDKVNKSLDAVIDFSNGAPVVWFKVRVDKSVIYKHGDINMAVNEYNKI